jgi:diguanylate cyclase (GGDEF)-like protein/PAS domain S-box-containing protein
MTEIAGPADHERGARRGPPYPARTEVEAGDEGRWRALVDDLEAAVLVLGVPDARVLDANPAARRLLGLPPDGCDDRPVTELVPPEAAALLTQRLRHVAATGRTDVTHALAALPQHAGTPLRIRVSPARWFAVPAAIVEVRDESEHLALAARTRELELMEQRYRQAFTEAAIGMVLVSLGPVPAAGTLVEVNRAMCELVGRNAEELRGLTFEQITHPDDIELGRAAIRSVLEGGRSRGVVEKRYVRPDGLVVWARVTYSVVADLDGTPLHLVSQAEDITTRKEAETILRHRAMHDPLTGLPNRAHLFEHLDRAIARAGRTGRLVAVLYVDVDDFKDVNDTLGHAAGDQVLMALARRTEGVLRAGDVAARLGGDELVVVCEDLAAPEDVRPLAARLVDALGEPMRVAGRELRVTASVGVATGGLGATATRLVRDADTAMYRAKRSGKARFEVREDAAPQV